MASPPIKKVLRTFHHARIGRNELDRLFQVAGDGAAPGTVTLTSVPTGTTLEADSLVDLINARASLPSVSSRTPWSYLHYEMDEKPDRGVQLEFRGGKVTVYVEALDSIWAHGQFARLEAIIRNSRGMEQEHSSQWAWRWALSFVAIGVVGSLGLFAIPFFGTHHYDGVAAMVLFVWAIIFAALCGLLWQMRSLQSQFNVLGEVRHGTFWSRLTVPERIGLSANVIAGLALFVALLALVWGK
ncbi:hypothetical protein ABZS53_15305 [Streptomyces sp. NPDC005499]|uniref:hypothetical protein n=1 Tax=Streptomyces sp. NPDC005499 TaxID=3154883 RepID=UPI0033B4B85F